MTEFEKDMASFVQIREALQALTPDRQIDSGMPRDLWIQLNGVDYHIEISRSIAKINAAPPTASSH